MRLSQENENCQGASNHQSPPPNGPQATLCLRLRFPKQVRLKSRYEFRKLQREGHRIQGGFLVFQVASEDFTYPRLGITVSKKFGGAVSRNLFKRRVREAFRLSFLPAGLVVHIAPKPKISMPTFAQIQEDFKLLHPYFLC